MANRATEVLLIKAAQDEMILDQLMSGPGIPDEGLGFHAQQAVEKLLKALLAAKGIDYPFTHRLVELLDLIRDTGIALPLEFEDLRRLTPFAIEFRYDIYPQEPETKVDWNSVRQAIRRLHLWVQNWIQEQTKE
jgi:HEPN domain-containing protein